MKRIVQFHIFQGEKYYVAQCVDLPIVTQAKTLDELIENIKEAVALQLEGENLAEFGLAAEPSILANFEVGIGTYAAA
jgi:predicted RNase H-like HicB family nuclease